MIIKNYFLGLTLLLTLLGALLLSGCGNSNISHQEPLGTASQSLSDGSVSGSLSGSSSQGVSTPENVTPSQTLIAQNNSTTNPQQIAVQIFYPDRNCEKFVPEKVEVSQDNALEDAIGKTIAKGSNGDFAIAGYRVNINPNTQIATIDLRLSPQSKRQFGSLTSCESYALFGSLRETLTQNPQWQIKDVEFTQAGEEIIL